MPKIVGLLTGINYVEDWIEPAIHQALNICDEVVVSIGANNRQLAVLQDSTLERAKAARTAATVRLERRVMRYGHCLGSIHLATRSLSLLNNGGPLFTAATTSDSEATTRLTTSASGRTDK